MGYSTNPDIVTANRHLFQDLEQGRAQTWPVPRDPREALRIIRRLREVLAVAALYPRRFPALAEAHERWSLHWIKDRGIVEARLKAQPVPLAVVENGVVPQGIDTNAAPRVGLVLASQCIEAWNRNQPSSDPVFLSETVLDLGELMKLHAWATAHRPRLMMLVGERHITISLHEAETASLAAWHPPEPGSIAEEFDL